MSFHPARLATEKADFRPALPTCFKSGIAEMQMAKMTYSEQLKHPNWQRKRLEMLSDANFECTNCGEKEKTLHVHHKQYIKGRMAWEYENSQLDVLCEDCHESEHESRELLDELLAALSGKSGIDQLRGGAAGYLYGSMDLESELAERIYKNDPPFFEIGVAASAFGWDGLEWREFVIQKAKVGRTTPVVDFYAQAWEADK